MTTHTKTLGTPGTPVRSSAPLLTATRWLSALHAVAGIAVLGLAAYSFVSYADSPDDETFAGLWIVFGVGYVVLGGVLVALGTGAALARTPGASYGCAMATALFSLVAAGPGSMFLLSGYPIAAVAGLVSFVLLVCAIVGLATQGRRESKAR
ncbi:hypothetical protein BH09ACT12_BH09ACT12_04500 [soil metagenome]